ncbi:Lin0512 family protein [bacterium]|nr:Lin0512 family protein [bacterium]
MAVKRIAVEFGMGTDLRGTDYTKAACRALRDALWHNSFTAYRALGYAPEDMLVEVTVGVVKPGEINKDELLNILPYGTGKITVIKGGLDILNEDGSDVTIIANAAAIVSLDIDEKTRGTDHAA